MAAEKTTPQTTVSKPGPSWPTGLGVKEYTKAAGMVLARLRKRRASTESDDHLETLRDRILDEALTRWKRDASFSTYAVSLVDPRLKDSRAASRRAASAAEVLSAGSEDVSLDDLAHQKRELAKHGMTDIGESLQAEALAQGVSVSASMKLSRNVDRWIETTAHALEGMWPASNGPTRMADYLQFAIEHQLMRPHGAELNAFTGRHKAVAIPTTFMTEVIAFIRKNADTGGGGWIESADTKPRARRGRTRRREPSTPAYVWMGRRHDLLASVVRHGLSLCGLRAEDVNRLLAPVAAEEARRRQKAVRILRRADMGLRSKSRNFG